MIAEAATLLQALPLILIVIMVLAAIEVITNYNNTHLR